MPEHYGQTTEEHLVVRQGVGIADLSHRGINRVTGDDRITWLQSLISNDILPLTAGHGVYSALMDHKGKFSEKNGPYGHEHVVISHRNSQTIDSGFAFAVWSYFL